MKQRLGYILLFLVVLAGCAAATRVPVVDASKHSLLFDSSRNRMIPVVIYFNHYPERCAPETPCKVAFINHDLGHKNTDYTYLASTLTELNYLVVSIQHQLPTDPASNPQLQTEAQRNATWQQGEDSIRYTRLLLQDQYRMFNWGQLLLVGHGDGGDLVLSYASHHSDQVAAVITLDNMRLPLPGSSKFRVLTIRGGDLQQGDKLIPAKAVQEKFRMMVVALGNAPHGEMADGGGEELHQSINHSIIQFLQSGLLVNATGS